MGAQAEVGDQNNKKCGLINHTVWPRSKTSGMLLRACRATPCIILYTWYTRLGQGPNPSRDAVKWLFRQFLP